MHKYMPPVALVVLSIAVVTSGCALRLSTNPAPLPTATNAQAFSTLTPIPTLAALATPTVIVTLGPIPTTSVPSTPAILPTITPVISVTQIPSADFCADSQPKALIDNFKTASQTSNATLLASLVSPIHGMDTRLYRDGRVVNYDQQHAQFLFDSNFVVDWGAAPGSGLETKGSFHEIILPALLKVFNKDYMLDCNQVQIGGATYKAAWPYVGVNFYSVYFPGTPANGNLDWRTWLIGMEYVNGKPYLYAVMQFFWEP
jgi:hypothetical protein